MLCCERRDQRFRVCRVTRDDGPNDDATTPAANASIALHAPLALNHSDLADRKKRIEQPGAPHAAGTPVEIANFVDVLAPKRTNGSARSRLGRRSHQNRLVLVDLSTRHETKPLVETITLARGV